MWQGVQEDNIILAPDCDHCFAVSSFDIGLD